MTPRVDGLAVMLVLVMLSLAGWVWRWYVYPRRNDGHPSAKPKQASQPRVLKPRTPDDCPLCQSGGGDHGTGHDDATLTGSEAPTAPAAPIPYSQVRSRRGRQKRLCTAGYACPNPACKYYGITDETVHALVGNGGHGKQEHIQDLKCQACERKFSTRYGTALYRLRTPSQRVGEVIAALVEGLSIGAAVRVFGVQEFTVRSWQTRAGMHAAQVHEQVMTQLRLGQVQLDELCLRLKGQAEASWLWTALDGCTKLMPVLRLGPRTQAMAHAVVHELKARLAAGEPLPVFTSDGLALYFYALTAHLGLWLHDTVSGRHIWQLRPDLLYGQLKKHYRRRKLVGVERHALIGSLADLTQVLRAQGWSGLIQTAFVERANLTLRQSVHDLVRRTWGAAQSAGELMLRLEVWRGYYHFVRPHAALRQRVLVGGQLRWQQRTPAMAAGLTSHRWTMVEFLSRPVVWPAPT